MLKKIDWYILRQFLITFIFCMLLFTIIAVAVDSSEKTDDFVKTGLSTWDIITKYYIGFVPHIWGLLYPLFVFIAVIFFTSKMAARSEIIALLATGTTYNRWLRTYVFGGVFFAVILWFAARYALPKANDIRNSFEVVYIDKGSSASETGALTHYKRTDSNSYVGIKYFDTATKTGNTFFLNQLRNDKLVYNVRAETIRWDTATKGWLLLNVVERRVDSSRERISRRDQMPIKLNFLPRDLRRDEYLKERLNTPDLVRLIELEALLGNEGLNTLQVERYRRTSIAFSVLLLTLIGAVVSSRKTRGGTGVHLAIGICIAVSFIIFDRFSTVFSTKGDLHPLIAAWIPNIVFSIIGIYVYRRAPK
ncbi:MAG TPA: LptF/LptG family permease [Flavisolibacter sp.]|jgi:lipopolysaccharide export system permease protein|nr:LptF/LptG family permease [Flavisolibacter sp.]